MSIKINKSDKVFSLYIRTRDNWKCRKCGSQYRPPKEVLKALVNVPEAWENGRTSVGLHNMHCFTRGGFATRYDEENCMAGCYGCHSYLDGHPEEKYLFFEYVLGKEKFEALRLKAHTAGKRKASAIEAFELYKTKLDLLLKEVSSNAS